MAVQFSQLIISDDNDPPTPFCLYHSFHSSTDCNFKKTSAEDATTEHENADLNQLDSSISLFESPLPQTVKPLLSLEGQAALVTPARSKSTPLSLNVDDDEKVWSPTMATPTCNGTVSIKSACSSTSVDQSNVSTPVSDVAQVKSGDKLKGRVRFQSSELLGRRLFTETEAPPIPQVPIESDCLTQNHITAIASNLSTHSIDLFNSPSKPVSPSDDDDNSLIQSQSLSIKSPSLDVLFMSNSQLDLEDSKRLTTCTPPSIHPPIDKSISMNDGLVVNKGLVKFVYPTSDKVAPPKRPRPPGLSRLKFSDKKFRIISPHSPSTNKTTPIDALDTPTGRPKPLVNEQLNHSAPAITSTFVPAVTSTPFPTPTRAHDNDKGQLECSEFKTGFGKDSVKPLEKADDAEHIEDDGSLHLPVDMDLEEFSTFTQIQPEDFNDDDDRATSSKEVALNVDLFNVKPHLLTTPLSSLGNAPSDLDKRLIGKNHEIASSAGVGFVTAKGNKIKVSSTAIERATLLLASSADDDNNQKTPLFQSATNEPLHKSVSFCFRGNESSMLNAESTSTSPLTSKDTLTHGYVTGFTTGDGRSISVCKDSLDKATSLIDDHRDDDGHIETANDGRFITGDVERLTLHTTKGLCIGDDQNGDNEEVIDRDTPAVSHGVGFTTAGGRNVSVSEKSLAAVKQLFNDDEEVIDRDTPAVSHGVGFTTAGGRNVSVSEKSLAAVKQLFNDDEEVIDRDTPAVSHGVGFTTAGGRNVSVSAKSLAAVKQLFNDEEEVIIDRDTPAVSHGVGFTTAGGRNVSVSAKSLAAVKQLFNDEEEVIIDRDTPAVSHGVGFTTAGGRNVSVSAKSLAAVKQLFNNEEEVIIDRDTPAVSHGGGFTTAGGRNVSVSEKSLAAVKQLFNDDEEVIDRDTPAVSHGVGFTTAGGRNVSVSEKSLAAVKQLFGNESPESTSSNNNDDNNAVAIATVDIEISSQNVDTRNDIIDLPTSERDDDDQRITIGDTPVSIHSNKRSWCGLPRRGKVAKPEMLCDRNHPLKPKQILRMGPDETTPMATPSHIKFQTTMKNKKNKNSANNNNPVWKGDMSVVDDTSADPLMLLSPLDLTTSQLHSFIQSSPLSPDTLDSSRSSHLTTPVNVPPPPPRPSGRVERQGGTIVSSRERPNCHRVPLVSVATDCGRVGGYSREELLMKGVSPSVFSVTAATAGQFVFDGADHFSAATLKRGWVCVGDGVILKMEGGKAGIEELWNSFSVSPGVDIKLINYDWFANHYHWIIWKLASLEVCFPDKWAGRALTVDWCLMQLKYRYDIEIDKAKRSILHKICEGDDTASRPMILCVNDVSSTTASNGEVSYSLQLTDGWYKVPAVLDNPLSSFVSNGSIKIGTKLLICGADLTNSDSPNGNPLEVWKEKSFSLSANSVRRCRWYSRLGIFCGQIPSFSLSSLIPGGGLAPSVNVVVARCYPILYVEKTPDGKRVGRRYKDEEKAMEDWEKKRQKVTEMICQRVEKEFEEELEAQSKQKKRRSVRFTSRSIKQLNDGEDIYSYFQSSSDPDSLMEVLSSTQLALLESYRVALATKRREEFQKRLKEAVEMSEDQMPAPRNVSALLKVLIVQYSRHHSYCDCMLNIWNCKHELEEIMKEGTPLKITNVRSQNYHKIHLTSTKTTQFKLLPSSGQDMIYYQPRSYTPLSDLTSIRPPYNEIDTVGLVVTTCTELLDNNRSVDKMYLTDHDGYLLVVKIWEGLASMMSEGSIKEGCVVAISNLCYHQRGNRGMPMASVCDRTIITQCPHERHLIMAMDEFRQKLPVDCSDLLESMNDYCINKTK